MTEAARTRLDLGYYARTGALKDNPLIEASTLWGPDGDGDDLMRWINDPVTLRVVGLIQWLAANPPSGIVSVDKIENYGLTSGLQLAAQVMSDPTVLFPQAFISDQGTAPLETVYTHKA